MPAVRIIPCLDCRDGRVVKGVRFAGLRDAGDPAELAAAYQAQGADELVVLDVAATPAGRGNQLNTVRRVREALNIPLTVGGGVRAVDDVSRLLDAGADKVSVNTAAVQTPAMLTAIAARHGSQCTVLALDAAAQSKGTGWEVVVQSGKQRTGKDAAAWAQEACGLGTGEILLTSWDRDGTRQGYDLPLLRAIRQAVGVPIIASGGAATAADLRDALAAGADAVLAASMLHDGDTTVAAIKQFARRRRLGAPMIVPSIDLMGGQTVQLVGGKDKALDAGDPRPIAQRFARVGEIAVVDLDAALGSGNNQALMQDLLSIAPCRVGGGIRDAATARHWLDLGATKVVLGTAARPEILAALPRERVVAALDARHGEVVVEGWQKGTGQTVAARMEALRPYVGGFLVTSVEREGRLQGVDMAAIKALAQAAGDCALTVAGGVTTAEELAQIDALGVDAQVGMALYTGRFDLADALAAMLHSDRPDGLWPTVVVDPAGVALGLVYSNHASLRVALDEGIGAYHSRRRGGLWKKGATSGATQKLIHVALDCDRDALRFTVQQAPPGFCHQATYTCWGAPGGLTALEETLRARQQSAPAGSYTHRLLNDTGLLTSKLREEAGELAAAKTAAEITHEAADLLYFLLVAMRRADVPLHAVAALLQRRALKVTRRPGDAKVDPP